MPEGPATVLGGLPVIAEVWFSGPDYFGEYDAGVDNLYWQKRDGSRGKPLSDKVMERINKRDPYWESDVIEAVSDHLLYEQEQQAWTSNPTKSASPTTTSSALMPAPAAAAGA